MNDWIALSLGVAFLCLGLVAGRRLGPVMAWWLALGAWFSMRLADTVWKTAVIELRAADSHMDLATWIPMVFGGLFLLGLLPTLGGLLFARTEEPYQLPAKMEVPIGVVGGGALGVLCFLALVQAHVMHPLARQHMPTTMSWADPVLRGLGQHHTKIAEPKAAPPVEMKQ